MDIFCFVFLLTFFTFATFSGIYDKAEHKREKFYKRMNGILKAEKDGDFYKQLSLYKKVLYSSPGGDWISSFFGYVDPELGLKMVRSFHNYLNKKEQKFNTQITKELKHIVEVKKEAELRQLKVQAQKEVEYVYACNCPRRRSRSNYCRIYYS